MPDTPEEGRTSATTTRPEIPRIGALLAPITRAIPARSLPTFLARLERGAADRYRYWASQRIEHAAGLLACAAREDEIARRIDAAISPVPDDLPIIEAQLPKAREAYYAVFDGLSIEAQLRIQASAELEGAEAWRGISTRLGNPELVFELEVCAALEERNAEFLRSLTS